MKRLFFLLLLIPACFGSFAQGIENIGGIGAQLSIDTFGGYAMPRIIGLVQNSPADFALHVTDYIIKVNDVSCKDKNLADIVALIRGEAGTKIKITTSGYKDGRHPKDTVLTRVNMQVAAPANTAADPATAFYEDCENEVKKFKKNGSEIIKTFTSDCGNYFFNFNAEAGNYHVRVITLEEKQSGSAPSAASVTAKVYDSDNETHASELANYASTDRSIGNYISAHIDGTITFTHTAVGTISIKTRDSGKNCKGLYIIVYR